jgi:hypothetical protein
MSVIQDMRLDNPDKGRGHSQKFNFRFMEFSGVRYLQATPKQHKNTPFWDALPPLNV